MPLKLRLWKALELVWLHANGSVCVQNYSNLLAINDTSYIDLAEMYGLHHPENHFFVSCQKKLRSDLK